MTRIQEIKLGEMEGPAGEFLMELKGAVTQVASVEDAEEKAIDLTKTTIGRVGTTELIAVRDRTKETLDAAISEKVPIGCAKDIRWLVGLMGAVDVMDVHLRDRGKQTIF